MKKIILSLIALSIFGGIASANPPDVEPHNTAVLTPDKSLIATTADRVDSQETGESDGYDLHTEENRRESGVRRASQRRAVR